MKSKRTRSVARTARALLRLPTELHRVLTQAAADEGLSFNEFCVRRLRAPADVHGVSSVRALVVSRARALVGDRLADVLVLGSWARGEAAAGSDIDVLLVKALTAQVERLAAISRALRRDRELAFYGAEDLTPSSFYREADAALARDTAREVVAAVRPHVSLA